MRRSSSSAEGGQLTAGQRSLSPSALWAGFFSAPWSFIFTSLYVFWEYVRPQHVYTWLEGPPWALGSLVLAALFFVAEGAKFRSKTPLNVLVVLMTVVVLASSIAAYDSRESFKNLEVWANWVIAFFLIANTATTERRWFIFVLLFMLWSTKMSQHGFISWAQRGFGFASWGATGGPGWFQNSGEFALQMGIFLPLSLYLIAALRPYLSRMMIALLLFLPVSAAGSIIASSSRGGLLALAAMALWGVVRSQHRFRTLILLSVLAPLVWAVVPEGQKARFQTAGQDKTSLTRLAYWKAGLEMANSHPILGVGHENWAEYYRDKYWDPNDSLAVVNVRGEPVVEVAHNSFIEVASQLGYSGLLVYCAILGGIWVVNARSRRILDGLGTRGRTLRLMSYALDAGVISIAVAGFFMSVAFYPFVWFQAAMTGALNASAASLERSVTRVAGNHGRLAGRHQALNWPKNRRPSADPVSRVRTYGPWPGPHAASVSTDRA